MPQFDRSVLFEMLRYRRPSDSQTEAEFIGRYIATLPDSQRDVFGNWHVLIGDLSVLWSSHLDTVHNFDGYQTVHYNPRTEIVSLSRKSRRGGSNCLGADDTAGVAIMRALILAGVPGHYIFHHGEEIGGIGSGDLARFGADSIASSQFAIGLDRRGYGDVITHQMSGRSCSDVFAESLASQLNDRGLAYSLNRGVFTDTANYTDTIGECTNLSVGYFDEHRSSEHLNVGHLERLYTALCSLDPTRLVSSRRPGDRDFEAISSYVWSTSSKTPVSQAVCLGGTPLTLFCSNCGDEYAEIDSEALDRDLYCSPQCEIADWRDLADRSGRYLDPMFEDVQNALRRRPN